MAYYSVIQYMPDHGRCEAVNVGLIIFRDNPYLLHVQMTEDNERVRRLFSNVNSVALQEMKKNLEYALTHPTEALKDPEDAPWTFQRLVKEMARRSCNSLNCVPFRACALGDDPQATITMFFKELVL
jgi:hypothetical protein